MENTLVAVSHAKSPEDLLNANVAGFIHILAVDVKNQTVLYKSPNPGALPGELLLAGSYKILPESN